MLSRGASGRPAATPELRLSFVKTPLDSPQLSVGEVEEVARPARWVEHDVAHEVSLCALGLAVGREVLDALAPRPHDRWKDDLLQLGVVGVVGSELPLLVVSQRPLQERPEDLGLNLAPVERGSFSQQLELVHLEMKTRRMLEQPTVRVWDARVLPLLRPLGRRIVEELEQAPQLIGAGTAWVRDEILDKQREPVAWNLPEVLSEHRPHALQDEVAPLVRTAATSLCQASDSAQSPYAPRRS